jgi:hypothetical protein
MAAQTLATRPVGEFQNNAQGRTGRLITGPVAIGLAVWAGLAALVAQAGVFQIEIGGIPVAIVAAITIPVIGFLVAWRAVPAVRAFVEAQDLALLTALQGWRVIGAVFIFLWAYAQLPAVFALPAGLGDVAVGLIAPFAAIAVALEVPGWRRAANGVVVAGLADFAVAVITGIGSIEGNFLSFAGAPSNAIINALPLVLIPGFLVPVFIILHVMAIIKIQSMQ